MLAQYIDHMGTDLSIINAAKVSFDRVDDHWIDEDEAQKLGIRSHDGLIRYLAKHDHWSPFAHTSISLRMQAPVPIRTQCFKHKQGFVENEESRRYISSRPTVFIPDAFRNAPVGSVKQGSSGVHYDSKQWLVEYQETARDCISLYEDMIADGVCPEQARFVLPQGCEVNWVWTGNVFAFSRFVNMRTDPHAQQEIQMLGKMVSEIIQPLFPVSWSALVG